MDNIGSRCTTITAVRGFRGKPQVFFTGGCPPTPEAGRWRRKGVGRREARRRLRGRRRPAAAHSGIRRSIRGRAAPQGPPATHPPGGGDSRKDRERLICGLPAAPRTAGGAARLQRLPQRVGHRTARVHVRDGGIALPQELDAVVTPDVVRPRSAGQSIVCI